MTLALDGEGTTYTQYGRGRGSRGAGVVETRASGVVWRGLWVWPVCAVAGRRWRVGLGDEGYKRVLLCLSMLIR